MAHCLNCDALISDRPDYQPRGFCDEECKDEYRAGADQEVLAIAEKGNNLVGISSGAMENHKHESAPDVKDIFSDLENDSNTPAGLPKIIKLSTK